MKDMDAGETGDRVVEPEDSLPEVTLEQLPEKLREAVARAGWDKLLPVQAKAIPYLLAHRDLMIQSRTGSGKTGAYLLPIMGRTDPERSTCQTLVLVPTRELAQQVTQEARLLIGDTDVRTVAVYGGVGYGPQLDAFRKGAHLVIGTPGRILDHLLKGSLKLESLRILVFDEADRMLSMGFYPDMKRIQEHLPRRRINGYMFSATFPLHVMGLAGEFLHSPETLSLSRDKVHVTETEHTWHEVDPMKRDRALVRVIEIENPSLAIIFCNTKADAHYLAIVLRRFGYDADELSSELTQASREKVMTRLRKGELRFLVATDVAARGIDIPNLSHVILYQPPEDPEAYIHRAGRTGRVGASGKAITLVAGIDETISIKHITKSFGIDMEKRDLPSHADVAAVVSQRVTALLEARLRSRDKLQTERMQRFLPLARNLSESEDETALIAMLLDDYYQQTLHGPLSLPPAAETAKRPARSDSGRGKGRPGGKSTGRPHRRSGKSRSRK
ncbi:MAG: DEAD/DEAH box helicase [Candidatus Eisenbacteria sp.]|nr:DEAD/DEAH box helicase [Candidatus Eisenbacteria bacterium]